MPSHLPTVDVQQIPPLFCCYQAVLFVLLLTVTLFLVTDVQAQHSMQQKSEEKQAHIYLVLIQLLAIWTQWIKIDKIDYITNMPSTSLNTSWSWLFASLILFSWRPSSIERSLFSWRNSSCSRSYTTPKHRWVSLRVCFLPVFTNLILFLGERGLILRLTCSCSWDSFVLFKWRSRASSSVRTLSMLLNAMTGAWKMD